MLITSGRLTSDQFCRHWCMCGRLLLLFVRFICVDVIPENVSCSFPVRVTRVWDMTGWCQKNLAEMLSRDTSPSKIHPLIVGEGPRRRTLHVRVYIWHMHTDRHTRHDRVQPNYSFNYVPFQVIFSWQISLHKAGVHIQLDGLKQGAGTLFLLHVENKHPHCVSKTCLTSFPLLQSGSWAPCPRYVPSPSSEGFLPQWLSYFCVGQHCVLLLAAWCQQFLLLQAVDLLVFSSWSCTSSHWTPGRIGSGRRLPWLTCSDRRPQSSRDSRNIHTWTFDISTNNGPF